MTHQWFSQARSIEGSSYNLHTLLSSLHILFLKWYSILLGSQEYRQTPISFGAHNIPSNSFLEILGSHDKFGDFFSGKFMAPKSKQYRQYISIMNPQKRKLDAGIRRESFNCTYLRFCVLNVIRFFFLHTERERYIYTHKIKICRGYPGIKSDTKKIE